MEPDNRSDDRPQESRKLTTDRKKRLKLLREENLRLQVLRDELITETANASKIIQQRTKKWKEIGVQFATAELQDTVHAIWKAFEWACDSKDARIKDLFQSISTREELANKKFADTVEQIDYVLCNFYKTITKFRTREKHNMNVYKKRLPEIKSRQEQHDKQLEYAKTVNFCNNVALSESIVAVLGECIAQKEEMSSMRTSELELWQLKKTNKMINAWFEYKSIIDDYRSKTDRLLKTTTDLAIRVGKGENIIHNQKKHIHNMKAKVERLTEIVTKGGSLNNLTNLADLRVERAELCNQLRILHQKYKENTEYAQNRIKTHVYYSNQTKATLEDVTAKGEKIINLHMKCLKFETTYEQCHRRPIAKTKWQTKQQQHDLYSKMVNFWQDFHEAVMIYKVLYARKKYFQRKNKEMRDHLSNTLTPAGEKVLQFRNKHLSTTFGDGSINEASESKTPYDSVFYLCHSCL